MPQAVTTVNIHMNRETQRGPDKIVPVTNSLEPASVIAVPTHRFSHQMAPAPKCWESQLRKPTTIGRLVVIVVVGLVMPFPPTNSVTVF
jgi:hypothetical protein